MILFYSLISRLLDTHSFHIVEVTLDRTLRGLLELADVDGYRNQSLVGCNLLVEHLEVVGHNSLLLLTGDTLLLALSKVRHYQSVELTLILQHCWPVTLTRQVR